MVRKIYNETESVKILLYTHNRSFRRKVLFALKSSLVDELNFIRAFTLETPKNYQLWQHRQVIVDKIESENGDKCPKTAMSDLEDTKVQLSLDAKNIHCWQYRQWLLRHFNLSNLSLKSEFDYIDKLLIEDIYNNSAWNHRMFLIITSEEYNNDKNSFLMKEFEMIIGLLDESNEDNECFWNYLAALMRDCNLLSFEFVLLKISEKIGSVQSTQNYNYLRLILRFINVSDNFEICEQMKFLHPINRALWMSLQSNQL